MITLSDIKAEIHELLSGKMTWERLERLNVLLHIEHRLEKRGDEAHELDARTAQAWTSHMENSDGSRGPRWTMDQTDEVLKRRGWDIPSPAFYAVMNSVWSDYGATLRRHGIDDTDLWAELAKDWICDEDAKPGKAARYYEDIVEH